VNAWQAKPEDIDEHAGIESFLVEGGYHEKQVFELIQNASDALAKNPNGGSVKLVLTSSALYCADSGLGMQTEGVKALLGALRSPKQEGEIGRFGLGFKSVLEITDTPQIFSFSGSFGFDRNRSSSLIGETFNENYQNIPVLRLAWPLDPNTEKSDDDTLAELITWASTIVRLPFDRDIDLTFLDKEFDNFPREFLLFADHVNQLILENRVRSPSTQRVISRTREDGFVSIFDSAERQSRIDWNVFTASHELTDEARADANQQHRDRGAIPVVWAVPKAGRGQRGQFWTFFPSDVGTTLTGILNAPWKTSVDRANLLDGAFNRELMGVAARLVSESLPGLITKEDPGAALDIIPARGREEQNDLATWFVGEVYQEISGRPSIPDQSGTLVKASELHLAPEVTTVPETAAARWAIYSKKPVDWNHSTVQKNNNRHSKAVRIKRLAEGLDGDGPAEEVCETLGIWLSALVTPITPEGSVSAIRTADECKRSASGIGKTVVDTSIGTVRIVLTEDGTLARLTPGDVFLPPDIEMDDLNVPLVHPNVRDQRNIRNILESFGISPVAYEVLLEQQIAMGVRTFSNKLWERFWSLACQLSSPIAARTILASPEVLNDKSLIKVPTLKGEWKKISECYLPGGIVNGTDSEDAHLVIDTKTAPEELLKGLGASQYPIDGFDVQNEPWFQEYREECVKNYLDNLPSGHSKPQPQYLSFVERPMIGSVLPFFELSEEQRMRFCEYLLARPEYFVAWEMAHRTQTDNYPRVPFPSPYHWLLLKHGRIQTSQGPQAIEDAVGPSLGLLGRILPIAAIDEQLAITFNLAQSVGELRPDHWTRIFDGISAIDDENVLGLIYTAASVHHERPERIRCRTTGDFESLRPEEVAVTCDTEILDMLRQMGHPTLFVGSQEAQNSLIERWGLLASEQIIRTRIDHVSSGEPTPIADEYPQMTPFLDQQQRSAIRSIDLVRCQTLERRTESNSGEIIETLDAHLGADVLYISDRFSDSRVLEEINNILNLGLDQPQLEGIGDGKVALEFQERVKNIRQLESYSDKLLLMLGRTSIETRLGRNVLQIASELNGSLSDQEVAEIALASFGVNVLKQFRTELEGEGFDVPAQWAGGYRTRQFVRDLGFSSEYAGFHEPTRAATLEVPGPSSLPDLHDYQVGIVERIRKLLENEDLSDRRAMLSLPTGSGKTRVAVQAITEDLRDFGSSNSTSPDGEGSFFVWIAQSDELCEQAVRTFEEVWSSKGSQDTLHISRLWSTNEATEYTDGPQVVVATIDKLHSVLNRSGDPYDWLTSPKCVVVDEAHRSMSPEYTYVLGRLKTNIANRTAQGNESCLLGLTATPYRGFSEEATAALANRFGRVRLDIGALGDKPYEFLQDKGYLAQVKQEMLVGADIELDATEIQTMRGRPAPAWLPPGTEQRIAEDTDRNKALIDSLESKPEDWQIIVFCASVDHAKTMAGILNLRGITSASISADTESGARRHYVEEFRNNRIRVLTNHSVLSQGFDAPSVRALYIARPVFSPNVYQQMIGRGLRGPKNGGKEECLIVNVEDTIKNFEGKLAFTEFEHLWS